MSGLTRKKTLEGLQLSVSQQKKEEETMYSNLVGWWTNKNFEVDNKLIGWWRIHSSVTTSCWIRRGWAFKAVISNTTLTEARCVSKRVNQMSPLKSVRNASTISICKQTRMDSKYPSQKNKSMNRKKNKCKINSWTSRNRIISMILFNKCVSFKSVKSKPYNISETDHQALSREVFMKKLVYNSLSK